MGLELGLGLGLGEDGVGVGVGLGLGQMVGVRGTGVPHRLEARATAPPRAARGSSWSSRSAVTLAGRGAS